MGEESEWADAKWADEFWLRKWISPRKADQLNGMSHQRRAFMSGAISSKWIVDWRITDQVSLIRKAPSNEADQV